MGIVKVRASSRARAYSRRSPVTMARKLTLANKINKRLFTAKLKGDIGTVDKMRPLKVRAESLALAGPLGKRAIGGYLKHAEHLSPKGVSLGSYTRGRGKNKWW